MWTSCKCTLNVQAARQIGCCYNATRPHSGVFCKTTNCLLLLRTWHSKTITTTLKHNAMQPYQTLSSALKHNAMQPSQRPLLKVPLPGNWDCPYLFYTQPTPPPPRFHRPPPPAGAFTLVFPEYDLPYKILDFLYFPRAVDLWASLSKLLFLTPAD